MSHHPLRPEVPSARRAFTLVELLVVIAIVGLLLALLLPAVQGSREAARRTGCANNFRQLGVALHHYHEQMRQFPAGNLYPANWSYITLMLPHLEQRVIYENCNFNTWQCFDDNFAKGGKGTPSVNLPVVQCPSETRLNQMYYSATGLYASGNYYGVMGTKSCLLGLTYPFTNDGMLFSNSKISMRDNRDGASSTLLVGERGMTLDLLFSWWCCGSGIALSGEGDNLCSTALGLSPGGAISETYAQQFAEQYRFWSRHPGGSQFMLVDGSVRFLVYEIDFATFQRLGTRAGSEPVTEF
jgi:prepilin-type N-terminal cleavage/methylation domain-containing protein/prepilin-type processing-associated H-X9-DG protein